MSKDGRDLFIGFVVVMIGFYAIVGLLIYGNQRITEHARMCQQAGGEYAAGACYRERIPNAEWRVVK